MDSRYALLVAALLLMAIPACNLPAGQGSDPELAATITAQALTIEARSSTAGDDAATPGPANVDSGAEVSVTTDTNCRTGPSSDYDVVLTMHPGSKSTAVGKYTPANYWIINNPAGGTCWLWGKNAEVTGDTNALPEFPAPAAPTAKPTKVKKPTVATPILLNGQILVVTVAPTKVIKITPVQIAVAPNAPANFTWGGNLTCDGGIATDGTTPIWIENVGFTWQDSINETGYRVYKNNGLLGTIPQNSTTFHYELRISQYKDHPNWMTFGVEAFNDAGTSPKSLVDVPYCP